MVKQISIFNPPDAAALMTTARSFGNYDLAGALADLIDNSITAESKNIDIICSYLDDGNCEVRIRDDGKGMNEARLRAAMRPASSNPASERSPDDLGRFGWGLKSASFSQAKILTVISWTNDLASGAGWNLDNIDNFAMSVYDHHDAIALLKTSFTTKSGTELIWSNCDRLSENGTLSRTQFNALVVQARQKLSLIFHRYLAGEPRKFRPIRISLNNTPLEEIDPFCRSNLATRCFDPEIIELRNNNHNSKITMQAFTLPHYSKLSENDYEKFGGEEGYIRNQGFYVYRNRRLIIWGTWFQLAKHGELSKLVRIQVDIPNTLDDMWKITVDKSDAQLPTALKKRMKVLIEAFRISSSNTFRSKGAKIDRNGKGKVWERTVRNQMIRYRINRDHPLVVSTFEGFSKEDKSKILSLLELVESEIPVESINFEVGANPHAVQQRDVSRETFASFVQDTVPILMAKCDGPEQLVEMLATTEPYASSWPVVEDILKGMKLL
jgi:hypothetical protein